MLKTKQVQLPPTLKELKNGTLWHTVTIPFGDYSGLQSFFTGSAYGVDTNIYNCSLPPGQEFIIKKISLMPSLDALSNDVNALISNSHFSFDTPVRRLYEGPAQTFYKGSQNLNEIFLGIKKLPKKTQQAILENMKIPSGFELAEPGKHLLSLEAFRATLHTPSPIKLKKPVKITCLLEGMSLREVY